MRLRLRLGVTGKGRPLSRTWRALFAERVFNARVLKSRESLLATVSVVLLLGCDSGSSPATATNSGDTLAANAATKFEALDNTYFKDSQAATAKGQTTASDAYQQAMNGLADADHAFALGFEQIPFPDSAMADATALLAATVLIETDVLLEAQTPGSTNFLTDLGTRNAADRKLRGDIGLDPSEVPGA